MEPVEDGHHGLRCTAKGPQVLGHSEDGKATGLEAPELVVVDEIVELLGDGSAPPLIHAGAPKLITRASLASSSMRSACACWVNGVVRT